MLNKYSVQLSIIMPCYNEESTLLESIEKVMGIRGDNLSIELIVVDDSSHDNSIYIAEKMMQKYANIKLIRHSYNQGKGAAIRTGLQHVRGLAVAIQDADLEYNPQELVRLLKPILEERADVVIGSRFCSAGEHRVLYFWHSMGNKFLTLLSNMFTDLNLTDMETCYKVFHHSIITNITIEENRFGFEPEIIAKIAAKKCRIIEMGISYYGRTYEEGKKIGWKDGFRALYCIFHYNAPHLPLAMQLIIYFFIGGICALFNIFIFILLFHLSIVNIFISTGVAYCLAAFINYYLCIHFLFEQRSRWKTPLEIFYYFIIVAFIGGFDILFTAFLIKAFFSPFMAKTLACIAGFIINFMARKYFIFGTMIRPQSKNQRTLTG